MRHEDFLDDPEITLEQAAPLSQRGLPKAAGDAARSPQLTGPFDERQHRILQLSGQFQQLKGFAAALAVARFGVRAGAYWLRAESQVRQEAADLGEPIAHGQGEKGFEVLDAARRASRARKTACDCAEFEWRFGRGTGSRCLPQCCCPTSSHHYWVGHAPMTSHVFLPSARPTNSRDCTSQLRGHGNIVRCWSKPARLPPGAGILHLHGHSLQNWKLEAGVRRHRPTMQSTGWRGSCGGPPMDAYAVPSGLPFRSRASCVARAALCRGVGGPASGLAFLLSRLFFPVLFPFSFLVPCPCAWSPFLPPCPPPVSLPHFPSPSVNFSLFAFPTFPSRICCLPPSLSWIPPSLHSGLVPPFQYRLWSSRWGMSGMTPYDQPG
eukprot:351479-Chlamydomonas_euryale.AAC.15